MIFRNIANKIVPAARNFHTSQVARDHHDTRNVFGSNLPFPVHNRYVLLGLFIAFFGSGLALPFVTLRSSALSKQ